MNPKEPDLNDPVEGDVRRAHEERLDYPALEEAVPGSMIGEGRQEAEEKARFQAKLLDTVGQAVIATDPRGNIIYWNRAAVELYGWSQEEAMGRSIMEVTPSEEMLERAEEIMGELLAGRSWSGEFEVRRKDGTTFPAMVTDAPVQDEQGNLVAVIGVSTDITEVKKTEELRRSEERFRLLAENARDLIFRYRLKPTPGFEYVSPSATDMTGYTPEEHYADHEIGFKIVHPDDRHLIEEVFRHPEHPVIIRWFRRDGTMLWTEQRNKPIYDEVGELVAIEGIARDVTERQEAEKQRSRQERNTALRAEVSGALAEGGTLPNILQRCAECMVQYLNAAFARIWTLDEEEKALQLQASAGMYTHVDGPHGRVPVGKYMVGLIAQERMSHLTNDVENDPSVSDKEWAEREGMVAFAGYPLVVENRLVGVMAMFAREPLEEDTIEALASVADVIAQGIKRKVIEERLKHQAFHDPLTDLPNRQLLLDRLGQALGRTRWRPNRTAVLFMGLDGFKVVNDSLGHQVGDRLVVAVAERLKGCLRPGDTLARFGGDEFTLLIEDVEESADPVRMAERIMKAFREPFLLYGRELCVSVSIGIALDGTRWKRSEDLLRDAGTAMYEAKAEASSGYQLFDPAMHERVLDRLELEIDIRRALEQEEFVIHYQPKVRLQGVDTIAEFEALLRWEHPQIGCIMPDEFIPLAEKTGLIVPIGRWVLKEACRQVKEWQDRYPTKPPLLVCVNVAAGQLRYPDLLNDVCAALRESGIEGRNLALEITESALVQHLNTSITLMEALREEGVRFALDDFGSEYSSLTYLMRLPVDFLKIDKSFVWSLGEDPRARVIVEAVITLAHSLGLEAIGEGVESAEQLESLREMGCDCVQGNYLAGPLPSEEVEELLVNRTTS